MISYPLQDEDHFTALGVACGYGHAKVVTTLITNGAAVNYKSKVDTCMRCTCKYVDTIILQKFGTSI